MPPPNPPEHSTPPSTPEQVSPVLSTTPGTPEETSPILNAPPGTPEKTPTVLSTPLGTPEKTSTVLITPPGTPEKTPTVLSTPTRNEVPKEVETWKCDACQYICSSSAILLQHNTAHHVTPTCHLCGMVLESEEQLSTHIDTHHKSECCIYCDYTADTEADVIFHVQLHQQMEHNKQPDTYQCDKCTFTGSTAKELQEHTLRRHPLQEWLTCKFCLLFNASPSLLQDHIRDTHSDGKEQQINNNDHGTDLATCLLYTSPSPRD